MFEEFERWKKGTEKKGSRSKKSEVMVSSIEAKCDFVVGNWASGEMGCFNSIFCQTCKHWVYITSTVLL